MKVSTIFSGHSDVCLILLGTWIYMLILGNESCTKLIPAKRCQDSLSIN